MTPVDLRREGDDLLDFLIGKVFFTIEDCSSGGRSELFLNKEGCLSRPRPGTAFFNWDRRYYRSSVDITIGIYIGIEPNKRNCELPGEILITGFIKYTIDRCNQVETRLPKK